MTPTLSGRIQTRLFLLTTVGGIWTLLVTPLLPGVDRLSVAYQVTFLALAIVAIVGIGWELLYHLLQQFRWEKDWPTLFSLVTGIPEGLVTWLILRQLVETGLVTGAQFTIHFTTTWVLVWLVANGPMRIVALRWRFQGGRLV